MSSTNGMVLQTGNYQPFSYDELVKPIDNMTKMQMAQDDAVNKLQQQSATLDKYLNESDTPYTYAIYDRMKKKLQMQADNLARYGLTPDTRQTVNDLATQYTADIVPIASAQSKKQEQVKNFIDNNNKTPGFMTSYDPSKVSVDEFFLHPDMMYQSTDVDKIRNIAKETAAAYQNQFRGLSKDGLMKFMLHWEMLEKSGATAKEILKAANEDPNAPAFAKRIIRDTMQMSGVLNWGNENAFERALSAVKDGMWYAIGPTKVDDMYNQDEENRRQAKRAADAAKAAAAVNGNTTIPIVFTNSYQSDVNNLNNFYGNIESQLGSINTVLSANRGKVTNPADMANIYSALSGMVSFNTGLKDTKKQLVAAGMMTNDGTLTSEGTRNLNNYWQNVKTAFSKGYNIPTAQNDYIRSTEGGFGAMNFDDVKNIPQLIDAISKQRRDVINRYGVSSYLVPTINFNPEATVQAASSLDHTHGSGYVQYDKNLNPTKNKIGSFQQIQSKDPVVAFSFIGGKNSNGVPVGGWFARTKNNNYYKIESLITGKSEANEKKTLDLKLKADAAYRGYLKSCAYGGKYMGVSSDDWYQKFLVFDDVYTRSVKGMANMFAAALHLQVGTFSGSQDVKANWYSGNAPQ